MKVYACAKKKKRLTVGRMYMEMYTFMTHVLWLSFRLVSTETQVSFFDYVQQVHVVKHHSSL